MTAQCSTYRASQLAIELPAMPTRRCADGQCVQATLVVQSQVGHEKLLCMHLQESAQQTYGIDVNRLFARDGFHVMSVGLSV